MSLAKRVPGVPTGLNETTTAYAGPPELAGELPGRREEEAAQLARDLATRAEQAVEQAVASVNRLRAPYPASIDHTALWLRGSVEALLGRLEINDPYQRLASVRALASEIEQAAQALLVTTRGISQRVPKMNGGIR